MKNLNNKIDLVVIGGGPGGYTAAFRAADLGKDVILIDKNSNLGGVCLNRGCIPSKSLLHISSIIEDSTKSSQFGIDFTKPNINVDKIHNWKNNIISNLNNGILKLATARKIKIINGKAEFKSATQLFIKDNQGKEINVFFNNCIIATGSTSQIIPHLDKKHPSILTSKDALNFSSIPKSLLIIGGGYIGLELGTVFNSLGTKVTVAEFLPELLSMADSDLVKPLYNKLNSIFENIFLSTEVTSLVPQTNGNIISTFKNNNKTFKNTFQKVLICTGRTPNTNDIFIEKTGIKLDENNFIPVNQQRRTLIPNLYAIGDITGSPMLAHKASYEGKIAAEVICGMNSIYKPSAIPSVIYTNPEIAWAGYTEKELLKDSIDYVKAEFPWSASGRAMSINSIQGKTKILTNKEKTRILGIGMVGKHAGDLISEAMLAIEMRAVPEDIALTIHPHPTLSETLFNAAEILTGSITDLYIPKQ